MLDCGKSHFELDRGFIHFRSLPALSGISQDRRKAGGALNLARLCCEEMMQDRRWPDRLSDWVLPPVPNAVPVRVVDTADAARALLAAVAPAVVAERAGRRCLWT